MDYTVSLSQELQISGERGSRREVAKRVGELTEAEVEEVRWAVHAEVHANFHQVLVERERARLAEQMAAFQTDVLRVVARQVNAGEVAPLTLRLAQAEVSQANQALLAARQVLWASRVRLARISGWPAQRPPDPRGGLDLPRDPPPADRLIQVAQKRLPAIRVGEAALREASARITAADRAAWPKPTIGIQYQRESDPVANAPSDIVLGTVSLPIPGFQRNQAERAQARSDLNIARAELGAERSLSVGRIVEAHSEVVAAAQRVRTYSAEVLPRMQENLNLLRRAFELGEIDWLALSIGRERLLRIQSDALAAHLDYFTALATLERVVGIDLWPDKH